MVRGRDKFNKYKPLIKILIIIVSIMPFRIRLKAFEYSRTIIGIPGLLIRYILLKSVARYCGDNVSIHPNVYLLNPQKISLGNNVSIHPMCYIEAFGEIEIGNNVSIAHGVTIMSSEHNFNDLDIEIKDQGINTGKVLINNNVWIGAKATILAGKVIDSGSIIGAGAVVSKDVNSNMIVGGVPARVIKSRE